MAKVQSVDLGSQLLNEKVRQWLEWDQNSNTRNSIAKLVENGNVKELESRLLQRLAFGTAGLRGNMGPGFAHLNDLVIIQTTQGFAKYLLKTLPSVRTQGVVIGFDNRHNSSRFSELATSVFLSESIPVYRFSKLCPTPLVPFAVLYLKCSAGIMITASHNPKEDNGYKVYWENGAQITSPHDEGIAAAIEENLVPCTSVWNFPNEHELLKDPLEEVFKAYLMNLKAMSLYENINKESKQRFVYTPMHGVGQEYVMEALKTFGLNQFISVEEQKLPDAEFPTVKYPNPEEGKSALDLAVATAEKCGCKIILANDPDADRFALAEKLPSGSWKIFSGNEIGVMLGWWMWHCHLQGRGNKIPGVDCYVIASTVSSKMLRSVGAIEGFNFIETLTGFKWIANKADELKKQEKTFLFGFEEAIGFMCDDFVLDKDGISACIIAAEMINWLESRRLTPNQHLEQLYQKYGYHITNNSYFICHHAPTINAIFARLRNFNGANTYPTTCGKFRVKFVRDLTVGFDNSQPGNQPVLPVSKSSDMITFTFEEGIVATLRTSGTEPKIKFYTEICGQPGKGTRDSLEAELNTFVDSLILEYFEPEKNNIKRKSD